MKVGIVRDNETALHVTTSKKLVRARGVSIKKINEDIIRMERDHEFLQLE